MVGKRKKKIKNPPIYLIFLTVITINSFYRKCSAEQESCLTWFDYKNKLCQLKRSTRPNDRGWHWIHTPTRSMTTISRWAGALVYSGDPAAVISGVIWSPSSRLTVVPVWWAECWRLLTQGQSLHGEEQWGSFKPNTCCFLAKSPLHESTPPRILNKIESGFGLSQKRERKRGGGVRTCDADRERDE